MRPGGTRDAAKRDARSPVKFTQITIPPINIRVRIFLKFYI